MRLNPDGSWRISLERRDDSRGYNRDNCILVAAEFNTSDWSRCKNATEVKGTAQWSSEKVKELPALRRTPVDLNTLRDLIDEAVKIPGGRGGSSPLRVVNGVGEILCRRCGNLKPPEEFNVECKS